MLFRRRKSFPRLAAGALFVRVDAIAVEAKPRAAKLLMKMAMTILGMLSGF